MARTLIVYGSVDGHTARVARRMADRLEQSSGPVELRSVLDAPARIDEFGVVIVGGAIRYGHYPRALEGWVRAQRDALASRPNAFFSVCLSAGGPGAKPATAQGYIDEFRKRTGWQPRAVASFAGALLYRRYNPFIRFMMRLIVGMAGGDTDTSRDYEYTDWDAVDRFAAQFAAKPHAVRAA